MVLHRCVDIGACFRKFLDVRFEGFADGIAACLQPVRKLRGPGLEHGRRRHDDIGHFGADLRLAFVDHGRQVLLAAGEGVRDLAGAFDQCVVDLAGACFERGIQLLGAGVESLGAGLEFADQRLATLGERGFDALQACFQFGVQTVRCAAEQRNHASRAFVQHLRQRAGDVVGALGERCNARVEKAGEGFAGSGDAFRNRIHPLVDRIVDRRAALVDAIDQRATGIGDRHRKLGRSSQDAVADHVGCRTEFVAQRFMGAGDGTADAFGMADQRVAFAPQSVDQGADAHFILRIGPLQFIDLGVDEGFELDGTSQRALDSFAHGRDLAADGLADHHDPVLRHVSGSTKRNANSVIDRAAMRISWARRIIAAKAQNKITGSSVPTASRTRYGRAIVAGRCGSARSPGRTASVPKGDRRRPRRR